MPSVLGASHVSFTVRDLSVALAWFEEVFGAEVLMNEAGEERYAAVLTLPQCDLLIGLVTFREALSETFDPARIGLDHFAFAVETEAELSEWKAHLDELGIANSGPIPVPPGAILNFKGPDQIALALLWRR